MKKIFKSKSLVPHVTDEQIKTGVNVTRFISFEAAIRQFTLGYRIEEKPIGYNVTEQGIEIVYP